MKRFVEGEDRSQSTLFPEHLDDYIAEDNPVRVIDVFVDGPGQPTTLRRALEVPAEKLAAAKKGFAVLAQELSAKEWIDLAAGYAGEISVDIKNLHAGEASDKPK